MELNNGFWILLVINIVGCGRNNDCNHKFSIENLVKIDSMFCDEKLKSITYNYLDSVPDSAITIYNSNGILESTNRFYNGKFHELQEYYYKSGCLWKSSYYIKGEKAIEEIEYFDNLWVDPGIIFFNQTFSDNSNDTNNMYKALRPKRHTLYLDGEPEFEMTFDNKGNVISVDGQPVLIEYINDTLYYINIIDLFYCKYSVIALSVNETGLKNMEDVNDVYLFNTNEYNYMLLKFSIEPINGYPYRGYTTYTIDENGVINRKYKIEETKNGKKTMFEKIKEKL